MRNQNYLPGGRALPSGVANTFRCVRAVIFRDPVSNIPSIVGTGFFIKLFGTIFFITARHVVENRGFDDENIAIQYSPTGNELVPFNEIRRYSSLDPDDTDHVDIIILTTDKSKLKIDLFKEHKPFDFSDNTFVSSYASNLNIYFYGLSPEISDYDYEERDYLVQFSCGNIKYIGPSTMKAVHRGYADVNRSCPDFDGLSGSPLFHINEPESSDSKATFAGMALRATRSSKIFYFMDAGFLLKYLLDYFLADLSERQAAEKLASLIRWYHPSIGAGFRPRNFLMPTNYCVKIFNGEAYYFDY